MHEQSFSQYSPSSQGASAATFASSAPAPAPAPAPTAMQPAQIQQAAQRLFDQKSDWITFYREILGVNGVVRQTYRTPEQMDAFEASPIYEEIQMMLAKLREATGNKPSATFEPTRVITVRLPKSLHESLRTEAHEKRTSMNKLCISKLLQVIDRELVPTET